MNRILIIDDDPVLTMLLSGILRKSGFDVLTAGDGTSGLKLTATAKPELVITDYQMPDYTGLEVLDKLKGQYPNLPVILLTAHGDVSLTIKAIQNGAFDFIEKPIDPKEILAAIRNGLQAAERLRDKTAAITPSVRKTLEENLLVGKDPVMREIFKNIGRVSLSRVNVLITGESGTGRERVARLIHFSGVSRDHPIIVVNCGAANEEELERELFGNADNRMKSGMREGKLTQAGQGTVVLNEVTLLPLGLQAKLVEAIKKQGVERTGEEMTTPPFHARVVATTSQSAGQAIEAGTFLKELFYQVNEFTIRVPPLRDRKEDIPELVNNLLHQLNRSFEKRVVSIDDEVFVTLQAHDWPGNIKELKNILTQAMILSHSGILETKHFIIPKKQERVADRPEASDIRPLADIEKDHISRVLKHTNWNKQEASSLLGITRPTLNAKIEKYQIG